MTHPARQSALVRLPHAITALSLADRLAQGVPGELGELIRAHITDAGSAIADVLTEAEAEADADRRPWRADVLPDAEVSRPVPNAEFYQREPASASATQLAPCGCYADDPGCPHAIGATWSAPATWPTTGSERDR